MKKKVLVMGGSYFIGKKVVDILLDNDYEVYTLNRGTKEVEDENVKNLKCDRNDAIKMNKVLEEYYFDVVVDISGLDKNQVEILYNSLNKERLEKFIFISSSAVYDIENFSIPYSEKTPVKENKYWKSYGKNKIEAENFLRDKFKSSSSNLAMLRPVYVYGEYNYAQRESFVFDHILNNQPIILPKHGSTYLQFIYTEDLANIIIKLINNKIDRISIFNVGNKKAVTMEEWVKHCENVVGKKANIVYYDYDKYNRDERGFFPFRDYSNVLDVSNINQIYSYETDFEVGLKNAFEWYCENKDEIKFNEDIQNIESEILKEINYK